ncbi:MAG: sigma-70 family RNA polymerase sigma factor [Planctomycetes bacterium]|nr:sigma-70 family RNA polymerase sigma factor [Planctomycetota bacterium]
MIEDALLKWRFRQGSSEALSRIYQKYVDFLLTLAMGLLYDNASAQDAVHDVFVKLAASSDDFKLKGSLKSYLATCVLNRSRDMLRASSRNNVDISAAVSIASDDNTVRSIIGSEQSENIAKALSQLPGEQREVIVMHFKGEMKFKQIARLQDASINTVQSRYRYGLDKLRSLLIDGEQK